MDAEEYNLSPEVDKSTQEKEISTQEKEISTQEKEISTQEKEISKQEKELSSQENDISIQENEICSIEKETPPPEKKKFVTETRLITNIDESILKSMKLPGYRSVKVNELDSFDDNEKGMAVT